MGSIVFNPSTQQPESVSVKTGAYTIPVGYYAYVTANVQGSDTFSINGVLALNAVPSIPSSGNGALAAEVDTSATNTTAIFTYTVPAGYYFYYNYFTVTGPAGSNYSIQTYINSQTATGINVAFREDNSGTINYSSLAGAPVVAWTIGGVIIDNQQGPYGPGTIIGLDINETDSITKRIAGTVIRPNSLLSGQSASSSVGSFWVPENTSLTVTSGSYTVSLYKNIA